MSAARLQHEGIFVAQLKDSFANVNLILQTEGA